jgi:hypothetical protein
MIEHELNNPRPGTTRTNTFTHDGVKYDLDIVRKEVRHLPRKLYPVRDLRWLLDECPWTEEDQKRYAYLGRPVFVVRWFDPIHSTTRITVVDGFHRLHRAVRVGLEHLPGIEVPDHVMDKARI